MRKHQLHVILMIMLLSGLAGCGGNLAPSDSASEEPPIPATSTLNVWCFQAGKADAFLFWNEAGAVLIDTGESGFGKIILEKMEELGMDRLDYLILTHFDKDHVGGAKKILSEIPVETVLQSNCPKSGAEAYEKYLAALDACGLAPLTVRQNLRFTLGDVRFTVDPPAREKYPEEESNNSSLIVTVTHGEQRMLFCGDAEELRLAEFLERNPGEYALVKLPHHGKYQTTLQALLNETKPAYAVVTSSDDAPEDAETLALLHACGVQTFLTREGPVWITSSEEELTVRTENAAS